MESTVNTPSATSGRALSAAATINQRSTTLESSAELVGRILLASLFLLSGVSKLGAYGATAAYMSSAGVPGALLPAVIAVELLGSLVPFPQQLRRPDTDDHVSQERRNRGGLSAARSQRRRRD